MRFFTNDNKDDDTDVKDRTADHPDDTVALPQQRGNSPWSSTPDSADSTGSHRRDEDDTPASDEPHSDEPRAGDESRTDDEPLIEDPTPPDHAVADTSPDAAAARPAGDVDTTPPDPTTEPADTGWAGPTSTDATVKDDGDFDDPKVVDADGTATIADGDDKTLRDEGGFDDPKAVDPATDEPIEGHSTDTSVPGAGDAAVPDAPAAGAAATTPDDEPAAAKPGEVPAPEVTTIFGADDARAFQDRWRDVQLRFVDSPKEATAEAATLVDEAVEKLTAALRGQKDAFRGESTEDTEKLRVELRGYRDIFHRIIGL